MITDAVRAATRGFHWAEQYAGHVWRGIWVGAWERRKQDGEDGPVRWVLDPIAHHCHERPILRGGFTRAGISVDGGLAAIHRWHVARVRNGV